MHSYSLSFFSLDSATVNVAGIIEQFKSGEQWDWHQWSNPTLQVNAVNTIHAAQISDISDTLLQDDPAAGQQTLAQDILDENGATLWAAGSTIEDEYEIELSDPGGTTYRLVAISIDDIVVGFVFEGTAPPLGTVLSYTAGHWHDLQSLDPATAVACFSADALIATARGDKPAGQIKPGDMVLTRDEGFQPVRWVGLRPVPAQELTFALHFRPIRIAASALGPGVPRCDLKVSPQHRILVRSRIAARMFGENEILVAAKHLTSLPGVDVDTEARRVTYVHLLFDRHQIVFANGAPSESLYVGAEALRGLDSAAAAELRNLMPHLPQDDTPQPARYLAPGQRGRKLAERLVKNGKHLFDRNAG